MAKPTKINEQNGKVKFRMIEFEMEGGDESLQDSLKSIAAALMRAGAASGPKVLKNDGSRQAPNENIQAGGGEEELLDGVDEVEVPEITAEPTKRNPTPRKTKIPAVKVLNDIRLDDVSPTLKEFCLEKSPSAELNRYLVIAYWFKNYKAIVDLTPDHFHTAYRIMGWNTPKDPAQPIRDLRHVRRGKFSPGSTPGTSQINHVGENAVNEMKAKN